jgi:hypothetical protein
VTPLTSAAKCFSLSHQMGEGRGEGKTVEQSKRTVEFTRCALTLNLSLPSDGRGKRADLLCVSAFQNLCNSV